MDMKKYLESLKNKVIEYRETLNLDSNITFGIEIEYENIVNYNMSYFLDYILEFRDWKNVEETDIMEYYENEMMNGEINSPKLTDTYNTWKKLSELLMLMRNKNGLVSYKCGTHINIGLIYLKM